MKEKYVISSLIIGSLGKNSPPSFYHHLSVSKGEIDASYLDVKVCDVNYA